MVASAWPRVAKFVIEGCSRLEMRSKIAISRGKGLQNGDTCLWRNKSRETAAGNEAHVAYVYYD